MVSSGTVTGDAGDFSKALTSCKNEVSGLSGSWTGASHDNVESKFSSFYSEASSIEDGLNSFAEAVNLYQEYLKAKKDKEDAESKYNSYKAKYNNCESDDSNRSHYHSKMNTYQSKIEEAEDEMKRLKTQINNALKAAKGSCKLASGKAVSKITSPSIGTTMNGLQLQDINGTKAYCIPYNPKDIELLGTQKTSSCCGVWATAYGYAVLEGKTRVSSGDFDSVCEAYNGGNHSNAAYWPGMNNGSASSPKERMDMIWEEVHDKNKPVVVATAGYSHSNHYVTVVGIREGADKENLKPTDLIVMDSSGNGPIVQQFDGKRDFDGSGYGLQIVTYN